MQEQEALEGEPRIVDGLGQLGLDNLREGGCASAGLHCPATFYDVQEVSCLLDRLQLLFRQRRVEANLLEGVELEVREGPVLVGVAHEEDTLEGSEAKQLQALVDAVVQRLERVQDGLPWGGERDEGWDARGRVSSSETKPLHDCSNRDAHSPYRHARLVRQTQHITSSEPSHLERIVEDVRDHSQRPRRAVEADLDVLEVLHRLLDPLHGHMQGAPQSY